MMTHKITTILSLAAMSVLLGCATTTESPSSDEQKNQTQTPVVNDYPTRDRVEYVLNCVAQHGGLTFITQYACGCKIDKIAEKLSFAEYEAARTFSLLKSTPGDAGGVFRDPEQSKDLRKRLKEAEALGEKNCFVK